MRLWHYRLLPYLPDLQFKGQLRELSAILSDLQNKGKTNHLLINQVNNYPIEDLYNYISFYEYAYRFKFHKTLDGLRTKYNLPELCMYDDPIYTNWHNDEYLKICMANLYEKYKYGVGKSKISDMDWKVLLFGYYRITNKEWSL